MTPDLATLLRKHGVTRGRLAEACCVAPQTVSLWLVGKHAPPPYIALTVVAVARRLSPVVIPRNVGVSASTFRNWTRSGRWPRAAALAAAVQQETVTAYERKVLHLVVQATRYYRTSTGMWRSRPVMGRSLPPLRPATPERLIRLGYLRLDGLTLTCTARGRRLVYRNRGDKT